MRRIPYPIAGQPIRASWGAAVTEACNSVASIGAARALTREMGPLGSGSEPLPPNQRDRRGGGKAVPQPFDPTFEKDDETGEIHLSAIGPGYAPWGRSLIYVAPPSNSSDVWTETSARLGLKITHPTTYGTPPTAEIVILGSYRDSSGASQTPSFPASTDTISYLPLYDFSDGRITLDLRCYLALGAFE